MTAAVITPRFKNNITLFKNAAKDSLPIPNNKKQIHFVFGENAYIYNVCIMYIVLYIQYTIYIIHTFRDKKHDVNCIYIYIRLKTKKEIWFNCLRDVNVSEYLDSSS